MRTEILRDGFVVCRHNTIYIYAPCTVNTGCLNTIYVHARL